LEIGGFRSGPWLIVEASTGTNLATEESFAGVQVIGSWFVEIDHDRIEGIEPAGRVSWGDADRTVEDDDGMLLTPGFNVYLAGRNRLMINWDVFRPAGGFD